MEAVQRARTGPTGAVKARLGPRRGTNIAKVAAARKLLTLVYYGLRDGHIRALDHTPDHAAGSRASAPIAGGGVSIPRARPETRSKLF